MSKPGIIAELEFIAGQLNQQLESGLTSIENCIAASGTCVAIIQELQKHCTDFRSQQSFEELDENYQMILKFKRSGGKEDEEDELVYTRYCTIQTHHCTRKLIDAVHGLLHLDATGLPEAESLVAADPA